MLFLAQVVLPPPARLWLGRRATVVISKRGKQLIAEWPGQGTDDRALGKSPTRALLSRLRRSRAVPSSLGYVTDDYVTGSESRGTCMVHFTTSKLYINQKYTLGKV